MTQQKNNQPQKPETPQSDASTKKPIRFQFGPDTTNDDIEKFLDMIFGPEDPDDTDDLERKN